MEIFLLWLDELDDVVFVLASLSYRLRQRCLQIGLASALTLVAPEIVVVAPRLASALAGVAGASVALWCLVALAFVARRLDPKPALARA